VKLEAIFVFKNIFNDIFEHNDDIGYQSYENHIKNNNIKSRKKHFKKLKKLKSHFLRCQQKYILFKQNNYL